jgi:hypothetical protein
MGQTNFWKTAIVSVPPMGSLQERAGVSPTGLLVAFSQS